MSLLSSVRNALYSAIQAKKIGQLHGRFWTNGRVSIIGGRLPMETFLWEMAFV